MTLRECIARYEAAAARTPATSGPTAGLTPKGSAAVALFRLRRQLRALTDADRADIAPLVSELLNAELPPVA
jgi:hypothetical protein